MQWIKQEMDADPVGLGGKVLGFLAAPVKIRKHNQTDRARPRNYNLPPERLATSSPY
ncbi:hypothetical protein [Microbulbifer celer]|uniref:Transposase n=1 Tax=Microbulbifer celer TaxID=435905 RepID=A0ABW3U7M4_9GAMM|nr:hypothetical protein [Microbulbifer celer]UFN57103.1 hypothetical protein LPW13_16280 [Microbulbifer celer]